MGSETSLVAFRYRLQQWAEQIQDCQNRPSDMKVEEWCAEHGIKKANYYYRLRRVREAYLEQEEHQKVVPVPAVLQTQQEIRTAPVSDSGIAIELNGAVIRVNSVTSSELLSMVLGVIRNAQ